MFYPFPRASQTEPCSGRRWPGHVLPGTPFGCVGRANSYPGPCSGIDVGRTNSYLGPRSGRRWPGQFLPGTPFVQKLAGPCPTQDPVRVEFGRAMGSPPAAAAAAGHSPQTFPFPFRFSAPLIPGRVARGLRRSLRRVLHAHHPGEGARGNGQGDGVTPPGAGALHLRRSSKQRRRRRRGRRRRTRRVGRSKVGSWEAEEAEEGCEEKEDEEGEEEEGAEEAATEEEDDDANPSGGDEGRWEM